jgi:hypothetical protein
MCSSGPGQGATSASPSTPTPRSSSSCSSGMPGRQGEEPVPIDNVGYFDHSAAPRGRTTSAAGHLDAGARWASRWSSATTRAPRAAGDRPALRRRAVTADNIMTFRLVVKEVALEHGVVASFMPKPFAEHPGSGMHTHVSLFEGDTNAFFEPGAALQLSVLSPGSSSPACSSTPPRSPRSPTSGSTPTSASVGR